MVDEGDEGEEQESGVTISGTDEGEIGLVPLSGESTRDMMVMGAQCGWESLRAAVYVLIMCSFYRYSLSLKSQGGAPFTQTLLSLLSAEATKPEFTRPGKFKMIGSRVVRCVRLEGPDKLF